MNRRSHWILSIAAVLFVGAMAQAKDVVLQDGGVVVGSTESTPTVVNPPTDNTTTDNTTTGTQDSPEPATLTLLGLGGLGALWKIRRRKNVAA